MSAPEQQLRTELRAESELITPGSLRPLDLSQAEGRAPAHRMANGRRRPQLAWLAPVAAAVSVAVITAVVAIGSHYGPKTGSAPGAAGRPLAGHLQGITALSSRDAWAVGYLDIGGRHANEINVPLIVHWNGSTWRRVPVPKMAGPDDQLTSIAGTSPDNLWAVGMRGDGPGPIVPMIMHWDGHSWRLQRSEAASKAGFLDAVTVQSATDAWAVGYSDEGNGSEALILHWNGRSWNRVPDPTTADKGFLISVTASSARDVWAVGARPEGYANKDLMIVHWNGSSWARVPNPHVRGPLPELVNVITDPAGTVWVTGFTYISQHPVAVILRWTGTGWQRVALPKGLSDHTFAALDILSGRDIWAAGGAPGERNAVIMHWNGVTWTRSTTRATRFPGGITGLSASSASDIWATGFRGTSGRGAPQILHWDGSAWTRAYGPASP